MVDPELGKPFVLNLYAPPFFPSTAQPRHAPHLVTSSLTTKQIPRDPASSSAALPSVQAASSSASQHLPHTASSSTGGYAPPPGRPPDGLDVLIGNATQNFLTSHTWNEFFDRQRDPRGDWGDVESIAHPARHLLLHYKHKGVPAKLQSARWTPGRKLAALHRGPHQSAKDNVAFLREEFQGMMQKGHWALLPARLLIDHPDLRLSPLGVVPQRDRRPRTISDYTYFDVNPETLKLAPSEAMLFGRALQRLLRLIHSANPRFGPVYLSKIDISGGFYRVGLRPNDAIRLAVLFPSLPNKEQLIGIPLVLQWLRFHIAQMNKL